MRGSPPSQKLQHGSGHNNRRGDGGGRRERDPVAIAAKAASEAARKAAEAARVAAAHFADHVQRLRELTNYEALGLTQDALDAAIKKARFKIALKNHPDKTDNNKYKAEVFKRSQQAYDVIGNHNGRRQYDIRMEYMQGWVM